jgi:hypothetical protein
VDLEARAAAPWRQLDQRAPASQFCAVWLAIAIPIEEPERGTVLDRDGQPVGTGNYGPSGGVLRGVGAARRLSQGRDRTE